jgi:hypothetical protein
MALDKPFWFDITKAKKELQWAPVDSNSGYDPKIMTGICCTGDTIHS